MHQHRKARLVYTLTQDSVLAVHPRVCISAGSRLAKAFSAAFGRPEAPLRPSRLSGLRPGSGGGGGWAKHEAGGGRALLHAPLSSGGSLAQLGRPQGCAANLAALAAAPSLPRALRVFSAPRPMADLIGTATPL